MILADDIARGTWQTGRFGVFGFRTNGGFFATASGRSYPAEVLDRVLGHVDGRRGVRIAAANEVASLT